MEWRQNIVLGKQFGMVMGACLTSAFSSFAKSRDTGETLTAKGSQTLHPPLKTQGKRAPDSAKYCLWMHDSGNRNVYRVSFSADGTLDRGKPVQLEPYDTLLPQNNGYILVRFSDDAALLTSYSHDHRQLWEETLPEADSPRWSMVSDVLGKTYIAYSTCNKYDAYRQAHVVSVNPQADKVLEAFFSAADDDYPLAQMLVAQPERLVLFVKSRGAFTVVHTLDAEAEILQTITFSAHPHSRWAVPLCHRPLENGDTLIGGYKEELPGQRRAWICRFDADMSALNGKVVSGELEEQAITAFAPQEDGTTLALCPPWKIFQISTKGFPTHVWEVPSSARRNALTAILPAPGGGCFITGRSYAGLETGMVPAVWLGKIGPHEFMEL